MKVYTMNELTRELVIATALDHRNLVKDQQHFGAKVEQNYWNYLVIHYGVDLKNQAMAIWFWSHPEDFDESLEFLADYGAEEYICGIVENMLQMLGDEDEELRLDPWSEDLPRAIVEPKPNQVAEFYPDELARGLEAAGKLQAAGHKDIARVIRQGAAGWLPAERIADAVYWHIGQDQTCGLPMFAECEG